MIETIKKFIIYIDKKVDIKKFLKFGTTGVLNTLVDLAVYSVCIEILKLDVKIAQPIGQFFAIINSYIINKNWTFRDTHHFRDGEQKRGNYNKTEMLKFLLVNGGSIIINGFSVYGLHDVLGINKYLCKIPIAFVTVIINYFGNKFFVFKQGQNGK